MSILTTLEHPRKGSLAKHSQLRAFTLLKGIHLEPNPFDIERDLITPTFKFIVRTAMLHLQERCERAIQWALKMEPSIRHLVVSGGVASNQYVRAQLDMVAKKNGLQLLCPPPQLYTDNEKLDFRLVTGIVNFIK
ncbi:O-sialoglycoprotein endopeptidase [Vigna unguiculata]|uniref:O-sialoglycoprotein endopeptidase n=1 Tax=Vigna unguiculata TaxID=3917 RepID=A0A4D6KSE2_VIGUN|nr:O-sialoglycoprotein endopeptidase [Vigna unguiculata]